MRVKRAWRRTGALLGITVLLAGVAVACSDDGVDTSSDTTPTTAAAPPKPADDGPEMSEDDDEDEAEVFDPSEFGMQDDDEQASAAGEFMDEVEDETDELADDGEYTGYVGITDDSGALYIEVPEEFVEVNGALNSDGLPQVDAAPDLQDYTDTWGTSGITYSSYGPSTTGYSGSEEAFDSAVGVSGLVVDNCELDYSETYTEDTVEYTVGYFLDCAGTDTDYGLVYIWLDETLPILGISYQLTSYADGEAFETALATFDFDVDGI